jgi:hypothetical protein
MNDRNSTTGSVEMPGIGGPGPTLNIELGRRGGDVNSSVGCMAGLFVGCMAGSI